MGNFINKTQGNFTIIQNAILNSGLLSFEEKGLYCYLLSKPDGWNFSSERIQLDTKEKLGAVKRILKSLENTGLLIRYKTKNNNGKFTGINYEITDNITVGQFSDNGKTDSRKAVDLKTDSEKTINTNAANISNTINSNTDIENNNLNNKEIDNKFSGENLPNTNPEDVKDPKPKKANKGGASHQIVIDTYYEWFKNRNNGIKPKIDGAEAKAARMLADYFRSLQMEFEPETLDEHLPEKVQKIFNRILNSWETLEPFLQKQVKLTQINSNITNIVNYLKNGKQATNNNYKQQPVTNDTIASRFTNFNKAFGER